LLSSPPRRSSDLPLLGLVLVLAGFMSLEMWALGLAPVIAFFLGWGLHNDLAYDADPWWLHLAAHVPGRVDRAGRVLGSAVWGLPLVVAAAVAGGLLADRSDMVPALVGTGVAVLGAGYGVSSVAAVIAPYWAPAPGENPNAVPPGDRKSTRLNSSHVKISYAVFCLKKKKNTNRQKYSNTNNQSN